MINKELCKSIAPDFFLYDPWHDLKLPASFLFLGGGKEQIMDFTKTWDYEWKVNACINFFMDLAVLLSDYYEIVGSCNQDISSYLVPKGTSNDISYYGKPARSFRISDHWNWYANLKKCDKPNYIQCLSVDLPWAKKRPNNSTASKPIKGIQVSLIGKDGKYHAVFGEVFNRKTKKWNWLDADPKEVANDILSAIA